MKDWWSQVYDLIEEKIRSMEGLLWGTAALDKVFILEMQEIGRGQRGRKRLRNHETSELVAIGPQMKL